MVGVDDGVHLLDEGQVAAGSRGGGAELGASGKKGGGQTILARAGCIWAWQNLHAQAAILRHGCL